MQTTSTPVTHKCHATTRKGTPCKAKPVGPWSAFCRSHFPIGGTVEFVGGPLDGMGLHSDRTFVNPEPNAIPVIRDGDIRAALVSGYWHAHRENLVGMYEQAFKGTTPIYKWRGPVGPIEGGRPYSVLRPELI